MLSTISGKPAIVDASNNFRGTVPTVAGTNTFTIVAKDATGNTKTQQYEVDVAGTGKTFAYDANGNLTDDSQRQFGWDARNQLRTLASGDSILELQYDGLQKKRRVTSSQSSIVVSDLSIIWCESRICEEREWTSGVSQSRFEAAGQVTNGMSQLFTLDHLGSVRTLTDGVASVTSRSDFDPWGRQTITVGSDNASVSFTGNHKLEINGSALIETPFRQYSPELARWLSEDPSGTASDLNMFRYVGNRPINLVDPSGLAAVLNCESIKQSLPGTGISFLLPVRHCYIQVECEELDDTLEIWGPGPGGRPGYGRPHRLPSSSSDDRKRQQPTVSQEIKGGLPCKNCDLERKLVNCYELLKDTIPPYVATGPNSNTFAQQVIQCAGGRVRFPWNAPGAQ